MRNLSKHAYSILNSNKERIDLIEKIKLLEDILLKEKTRTKQELNTLKNKCFRREDYFEELKQLQRESL
jgi:hypothetical protein